MLVTAKTVFNVFSTTIYVFSVYTASIADYYNICCFYCWLLQYLCLVCLPLPLLVTTISVFSVLLLLLLVTTISVFNEFTAPMAGYYNFCV